MKKGRMAAECMLRLLAGELVDVHNRILPVQLICRDSVRKI